MSREHTISVVVPVYRGELTLGDLVNELVVLVEGFRTPEGRAARISEVLLVHDCGPDRSDVVIRELADEHPFIRAIWLSRNFGQHAATIAGISSSGSEWVVTLDEDGQFNPSDIGRMLDLAISSGSQLIYGISTVQPPHGALRNAASSFVKKLATRVLSDGSLPQFSSFRLMLGEIGRGVAAYVGPDVYLDIALSWAFGSVSSCPVEFRQTDERQSGYSFRTLLAHFWRLFISIGPRTLRIVSFSGFLAAGVGFILALIIVVGKLDGRIKVSGWPSLAVLVLAIGGLTMFSLGIVAEYIGATVRMAMGKPLYLIISDQKNGPLKRGVERESDAEPSS